METVNVRPNIKSDFDNFNQIFIKEMYAPVRDLKDISVIVDVGAYVGYTVRYFNQHYPGARIVAIEPEPGNYKMLELNVIAIPRIELIQTALWHETTNVTLIKNAEPWRTQISNGTDDGTVLAMDIPAIMDSHKIKKIDLLKIDIEDAERHVFAKNTDWLKCVRNIAIELHSSDAKRIFNKALKEFDYSEMRYDELTIITDLKPV